MAVTTNHPIDIGLWRKVKSAPQAEKWKWSWKTWGTTLSRLFTDNVKIEDLECPVCGEKKLYAYFLAVSFNIPRSKEEGHRVYIAERWFGCRTCDTQIRDQGEIPRWMKEEDIRWATDKKKRWAEQKLARSLKSRDVPPSLNAGQDT